MRGIKSWMFTFLFSVYLLISSYGGNSVAKIGSYIFLATTFVLLKLDDMDKDND